MPHWGKMTGSHEKYYGFFTGSVIFSSLLDFFGITGFFPFSVIFFIIAIVSLLDDLMPYGRQSHVMTEFFYFALGSISYTALLVINFHMYFLAISFAVILSKVIVKVVNKVNEK